MSSMINFFPRAFDSSKSSRNCPMAGSHPVSTPCKTLTIFSQSEGADDLKNAPPVNPAAPRCHQQSGGGSVTMWSVSEVKMLLSSIRLLRKAHSRCYWFRRITTEPMAVAAGGELWRITFRHVRALSKEHWKNWMERDVDDREPRSLWAGPDVCRREGPLRGSIPPPPAAWDAPPPFTPRVMNEQGLPSAHDSQRIFISFHFWPFWYSANPQGLACIIISEDQKRVFRVSTNSCWLDLMVLQPILILIALLKYSKYLYTN